MLHIVLPQAGDFELVEFDLEHSLVSLSKWEEMYEKPFYTKEEKTEEETKSYARHMLVTPNISEKDLERLNVHHYNMINRYINRKSTATTFVEREPSRGQPEAITSELIYYWMLSFHIPFDPCQTWHLNRLMTLIRVTGAKQAPPKKMTKSQIFEQQRKLNEERRREMGTNG